MAKTYLIIGGTTGIGKTLANRLVAEGHHVIAASRAAEGRIENGEHFTVKNIDATDPEADWSFLPEKLDGVAYCAGSINLKPFHRLKTDDFEADYKVNLIGAVHTLQAALPALKKTENASVVLFSTVAAQRGMTFHASVASAKGATEGLVRSLSAEWAPKIRVNAVALSLTDTPMAERLLSTDSKKEAGNERHPLKRYGQPEDVAEAAFFLLSEKASWITGQVIGVDGGMSTVQNI